MIEPSKFTKGAILLIVFGLAMLANSGHVIVYGRESALTAQVQPSFPQLLQTKQAGGADDGAAVIELPDRSLPIYEVFKRGYPVDVTADLQWFIRDLAEEHGFDERLIFGLILKESTFDPNTIGDRGRSLGLGQIQQFWITRANIERLDDNWRERDLLCPYDNLTTMMELWLHAAQRYNLDLNTDLGFTRFVFWYMTGRDPRNVTYWRQADQVRRYAAELVLIEH